MRRTVAVVLIALGVFCLALAPMMRTWMSSSLMKTPLDYYNPTVNVGEVTYFNIEDVELVEDAGRGWRRAVPSPQPQAIVELGQADQDDAEQGSPKRTRTHGISSSWGCILASIEA
jgi:hypothetical protein